MTTEIWCLFNDEKELLGAPLAAKASHIDGLKVVIEEQCSHLENVKAVDLAVWRCKKLLLSTQVTKELQEDLLKIDLLNEEQVVELASGAEIADLGLGEDEVLLVQVPGAFSCSQVCLLSFSLISSLIDTSPRTEEKQ